MRYPCNNVIMTSPSRKNLAILPVLCSLGWGCLSSPAWAQSLSASIVVETFSAGRDPQHLISDGENIWVTNTEMDTVTKLRASDGAKVGVFDVGEGPGYLTFDGANVWISNFASGTVSKLRARDGSTPGTFDI